VLQPLQKIALILQREYIAPRWGKKKGGIQADKLPVAGFEPILHTC
jgi:hypothetical protein